jgi:ornithine decarboxylase
VQLLLETAKELQLNLVGVSFHVGSGATNPVAFSLAIKAARGAFDKATALGFAPHVLDIGGGFSGFLDTDGLGVAPVAAAVNAALLEYFPGDAVTVMAEPGRFMAEAAATLVTNVYGCRQRIQGGSQYRDYWITDGVYGSMNCLLYDHAELTPRVLANPKKHNHPARETYLSTLFGPTCDGLDTVMRDVPLCEMEVGDWILFAGMGAYTLAAGSDFNGMNVLNMKRIYSWSTVPLYCPPNQPP